MIDTVAALCGMGSVAMGRGDRVRTIRDQDGCWEEEREADRRSEAVADGRRRSQTIGQKLGEKLGRRGGRAGSSATKKAEGMLIHSEISPDRGQ